MLIREKLALKRWSAQGSLQYAALLPLCGWCVVRVLLLLQRYDGPYQKDGKLKRVVITDNRTQLKKLSHLIKHLLSKGGLRKNMEEAILLALIILFSQFWMSYLQLTSHHIDKERAL